ncbi:hypothetical protein SPB21_27810 [Leptothoe sp. ISB3NOV94-8A]|uniref:hypothetical protein n=1 Tax=Adonisia turfae TaxID=2950184 RepID=UPI0013D844BF|nr:hypothetical protein [Adonisia turfae]MDV3353445.1 hypothetical protein [Leptothoe sp. LEGE 181152]
MGKVLQELDLFFWIAALMIAGMTIVDVADIQMVSPYSDFVQAMTEPVDSLQ